MLGLFWKKATNKGAIWGVVLSIPIALYFKVAPQGWSEAPIFVTLPFMHQMMWTWILSMVIIMAVSWIENKGTDNEKGIVLSKKLFQTDSAFNISAIIVCIIVALLYLIFW